MRLTVLVDHESVDSRVRPEWGTSILIESGETRALFDMGSTGLFADNARELGIDVSAIDLAVLSHSHVDHGGGLARFLAENPVAPVWLSSLASSELYLKLGPIKKPVGLDGDVLDANPDRLRYVSADTVIAPGFHLLAELPNVYAPPRGNRVLYRREEGHLRPDRFDHELALVVEEEDGMVLLTGCSHHGVLNMIEAVRSSLPGKLLKAVVGGFHCVGLPIAGGILGDTDEAIEDVALKLRSAEIPRIVTMHCTHQRGYKVMSATLGQRIEYVGAGSVVEL